MLITVAGASDLDPVVGLPEGVPSALLAAVGDRHRGPVLVLSPRHAARGAREQAHVLVAARPDRTIFTRFIPANRPGEGSGTWRRYWERWSSMTLAALPPEAVELIPSLARFAPPAEVVDKIKARREAAQAEIERITARLEALPQA